MPKKLESNYTGASPIYMESPGSDIFTASESKYEEVEL